MVISTYIWGSQLLKLHPEVLRTGPRGLKSCSGCHYKILGSARGALRLEVNSLRVEGKKHI
jgi:hypothetical protein